MKATKLRYRAQVESIPTDTGYHTLL